jgi:hypothetical protein
MREKGNKTKKNNREAKRKRIIELNQKVFEQKITDDELIELYKLTKHKKCEKGNFSIKEGTEPKEQSLLITKIPFSQNKKLYQKEYIDENNNILTKEYIVEYYLGGVEKKQFRKQITQFGIKQYSRNWDENRHLIKKEQNRKSRENLKKFRNEIQQKKAVDTKLKEENEMIKKMREGEYIENGLGYYDDAGIFNFTKEYKLTQFKRKMKMWMMITIGNLKKFNKWYYIPQFEIKREADRIEELKRYAKEASVPLSYVPPFVALLQKQKNKK